MGTELERRGRRAGRRSGARGRCWAIRSGPADPPRRRRGGRRGPDRQHVPDHRRALERGGAGGPAPASCAPGRRARPPRGGRGPAREVFVAGSLSPLEDCYRPDLVPDDAALAREHASAREDLAYAGVDLILVETHNTVRELAAARPGGQGDRPSRARLHGHGRRGASALGRARSRTRCARSRRSLPTRSGSTACRPRTSPPTSGRWPRRRRASRSSRTGISAAGRGRRRPVLGRGASGGVRRRGPALGGARRADRRRLLRHDRRAHRRDPPAAGRRPALALRRYSRT